jgi:hypothetical protein
LRRRFEESARLDGAGVGAGARHPRALGARRAAKGYRPSGEIPIAVFFMVDEKADDQTVSDAATSILRAAKLSLARFNSERLAGSARTLNESGSPRSSARPSTAFPNPTGATRRPRSSK